MIHDDENADDMENDKISDSSYQTITYIRIALKDSFLQGSSGSDVIFKVMHLLCIMYSHHIISLNDILSVIESFLTRISSRSVDGPTSCIFITSPQPPKPYTSYFSLQKRNIK